LLTRFALTAAAREMVSRFHQAEQQCALPLLLEVLELEAQDDTSVASGVSTRSPTATCSTTPPMSWRSACPFLRHTATPHYPSENIGCSLLVV
jgi:hypothetical protein